MKSPTPLTAACLAHLRALAPTYGGTIDETSDSYVEVSFPSSLRIHVRDSLKGSYTELTLVTAIGLRLSRSYPQSREVFERELLRMLRRAVLYREVA